MNKPQQPRTLDEATSARLDSILFDTPLNAARNQAEHDLQQREIWLAGQREALEAAIGGAPLEESLSVLVQTAIRALGPETLAGVYLINDEGTALHHVVGMPPEFAEAVDGFAVGPDSFACGLAAATGVPVLTADVRDDPRWSPWLWLAERFEMRSCWNFPLQSLAGKFVGTFAIYSRQPREATKQDQELGTLLAHTAAMIIARQQEATVRKQAEAALEHQRRLYEAVLATTPDFAYIFDLNHRFIYANEGLLTMWGKNWDEVIGKNCLELGYEPWHAEMHDREIEQVVATRQPIRGVVPFTGTFGRRLYDYIFTPVLGPQGEVQAVAGTTRDVTEIKQTEEALRDSQEQLAAELAGMTRLHELSLRLANQDDLGQVMREVMSAAAELLATHRCTAQLVEPDSNGEPILRLVGMNGFEQDFGDRFAIVTSAEFTTCAAILRNCERVIVEDLNTAVDFNDLAACCGPLNLQAVMSTPLCGSDGTLLGVFTTYWDRPHRPSEHQLRLVDLYAQQAARQIERRAADQALRQSEERFRMLADNMAQLAWTCDQLGNATWYNQRWLDYTGLSLEAMKGSQWQQLHHPDHLARIIASVKRSNESGDIWEDTFPLRGADGEYRWFLSKAVPIRNSEGKITLWFGTSTDVTEQRQAEEALREADRRKDEFLATLAHELRNPLAPIRSGLEIMRIAKDDPTTIEEIRSTMVRQTEQLVRLIDDLMDVSRITRGKLTLQRRAVEIKEVVKSAVEAVRPYIEEREHELSVQLPAESLMVDVDPHRLAQVLSNLLHNAAKYSPQPGPIHLTARHDSGELVLTVRDQGVGIPQEKIDEVFEMFAQIGRTSENGYNGLGIGLTLAKSLIEMHGGTIRVSSDGTDQGTEFEVRLPHCRPVTEGDSRSQHPDDADARGTKQRVLIVDDNQDAARMLGIAVEMFGNEVQVAHDGLEAIDAAAKFHPHVVLLDLGMPRMDGYEAAARIRQLPGGNAMVLVALTGWGQAEDKRRTRAAGFDHHLVKPADPAALNAIFADSQSLRNSS